MVLPGTIQTSSTAVGKSDKQNSCCYVEHSVIFKDSLNLLREISFKGFCLISNEINFFLSI